jgi:hypothetical protein
MGNGKMGDICTDADTPKNDGLDGGEWRNLKKEWGYREHLVSRMPS